MFQISQNLFKIASWLRVANLTLEQFINAYAKKGYHFDWQQSTVWLRKNENFPWYPLFLENISNPIITEKNEQSLKQFEQKVVKLFSFLKRESWKKIVVKDLPDRILLEGSLKEYLFEKGVVQLRLTLIYGRMLDRWEILCEFHAKLFPTDRGYPYYLLAHRFPFTDSFETDLLRRFETVSVIKEQKWKEIQQGRKFRTKTIIRRGPFFHFTNNVQSLREILKGKISPYLHQELRLPTISVTYAPSQLSHDLIYREYLVTLKPLRPLKVLSLDAELYQFLTKHVTEENLEKIKGILVDPKNPTRFRFDAIEIPLGVFDVDEFELAILNPSILKISKIKNLRKLEFNDLDVPSPEDFEENY